MQFSFPASPPELTSGDEDLIAILVGVVDTRGHPPGWRGSGIEKDAQIIEESGT